MPYDDDEVGLPRRDDDEQYPGRTPQQAEGEDGPARGVPAGEPGKTPGSAEGDDDTARRPSNPPY